jgi:RimJ/RimL family protein N-acetyltransferase
MTEGLHRGCAPLDIPVLETERLVLRALNGSDAPAIAALHGNMDVMRYLGGKTDDTLFAAYDAILKWTGHWALHGCGKWAVAEKVSGALVGRVGYLDTPYEWPGLELGWTFAPVAWGKGYATEASAAARDWGFRVLGAERIISMIDLRNTASQAVARRIGETPWQPFAFRGIDNMLWSMTRAEWQALA